MPTPVPTARQCLTHDAALALDDAVSVARRRSHTQTTSLHAISSLLSLPSSPLREACTRARNTAYTSRIQFKALELCLGVSLDRLPSSSQRVDDPPVSNSLMAAIKRSQANQRRQPENFQFYHQQQQQLLSSSSSSVSTVKVELQNMILAILDDPVVSRVFGDAGFRSCDIKLAILRPVHHLLRYKGPPVFLCNLAGNSGPGRQGFSFPFSGGSRIFDNDENFKKIIEVLVRKSGRRNPLLVGACANEVLIDFLKIVQKGGLEGGILPPDLHGLNVICIETEISNFVAGNHEEGLLKLRFEEVGRVVENCIGAGVVINLGDLKVLVDDNGSAEAAAYVVDELARLLEIHGRKLWLIGATAKHESYLEFLNKFPSIENAWELQFLPLTSYRSPMGETYPRSSLMESFVPFGGFFSTTSIMKSPFSGSNQYVTRCHLCNEKCKQEVATLVEGGFTASVTDPHQSISPSWLERTELSKNREFDAAKAKSSSVLLIANVEKKWDIICQRLHQTQPYAQMLSKAPYKLGNQVPSTVGFQVTEGKKESLDHSININNASSAESGCEDVRSCRSMNLPNYPPAKAINENPSKIEESNVPSSLSSSSVADDQASPMSANSVTTDLGLGVNSVSKSREVEERTHQVDMKSSFNSCVVGRCDQKDFKMLYTSLSTRIGRQEEAVLTVSQTVARCRTRNDKRHGIRCDIWLHFAGPDKIAKRKIAVSLAETSYGSRENFIFVDLSLQDSTDYSNVTFNPQQMKGYDVKFRGKTVVDYIAEKLVKKPLSVVFLENIDKADLLAQSHLSRALRSGRFSDSHGREVSISNAILVSTSSDSTESSKIHLTEKELAGYAEEDVLRSRGFPFQMLIGFDLGDVVDNNINSTVQTKPQPVIMNKRKLVGVGEIAKRAHKMSNAFLDLNLPPEESENSDDTDSSKAWLDDFLGQVDETVVFKPLDFDAMAKKITKEMSECFHKTIGPVGLLEIESKVVDQIVAGACLLEKNAVEEWIDDVLSSAFLEAQKRYTLSSRTVVKLVTCEGVFSEEQPPGILLPARIIMN